MPHGATDLLTKQVVAAVIKVHSELGPGFHEKAYSNAMAIEMRKQGIAFEREKEIRVSYDGEEIDRHFLDHFVDGRLALELKTVEELTGDHYAQIRSHMKAAECPDGLRVNFAKAKADLRGVGVSVAPKTKRRG